MSRVKPYDLPVRYTFAAEVELGSDGCKDVMRRLNRAQELRSMPQSAQGRRGHVGKRHNPLACRRLGPANCERACEQLHVLPLQTPQLAAPCSCVQAKDCGKVG